METIFDKNLVISILCNQHTIENPTPIFSNSPFFGEEKIEKGQMLCPDIQKELNECWSISDSKIHLTQQE